MAISRMTWINKPASWKRSGDKLVARSRAKTDLWSRTFYGYVTDNGHFFRPPVSGDFTFQARVNGQYAALYDQAGLMVRRDAKNWMKCGTEFFDVQRHASVVLRGTSRTGPPCLTSPTPRLSGGVQSGKETRLKLYVPATEKLSRLCARDISHLRGK